MTPVQCSFSVPPIEGVENTITVGRLLHWSCQGDFTALDNAKAELRLDPADKYKLRLLNIEKKSNGELLLTMTSYQAGNHALKAVQLVDSEHSFVLGDLNFSVSSVIQQTEEKVEPYGPMGPLSLPLSPMYYVVPTFLLLLLSFLTWRFFVKARERRAKIADIKKLGAGLSPMAELGRDLRVLQRGLSPDDQTAMRAAVSRLESSLKTYLARELLLPILDAPTDKIVRELRRYKKTIYTNHSAELRLLLSEMQRARTAQKHLTSGDVEQLVTSTRKFSDNIFQGAQK